MFKNVHPGSIEMTALLCGVLQHEKYSVEKFLGISGG